MTIRDFVADVERLLTRAHELFPDHSGAPLPAYDVTSAPVTPNQASGLQSGASAVAQSYQQAQGQVSTLNDQMRQAISRANAIGEQGRAASALIRDQARALGEASPSLSRTPAGTRALVAAMDQHLAAMQTQLESARSDYQSVSATLHQVAAGYRTLAGKKQPGDDSIAELDNATPKDSSQPSWTPGDPRHRPYIAGPGGPPPPTGGWAGPAQNWIEIGPGSGTYVRADELPGAVVREPGVLGPLLQTTDEHGLQVPYIEVAPHSGVWAPVSDFPDMHFAPPNTFGPPGTEEFLPGSGMWAPRDSLIPEPIHRPK